MMLNPIINVRMQLQEAIKDTNEHGMKIINKIKNTHLYSFSLKNTWV